MWFSSFGCLNRNRPIRVQSEIACLPSSDTCSNRAETTPKLSESRHIQAWLLDFASEAERQCVPQFIRNSRSLCPHVGSIKRQDTAGRTP
ncbi:unnamed protein product [Ixodes pacificus]